MTIRMASVTNFPIIADTAAPAAAKRPRRRGRGSFNYLMGGVALLVDLLKPLARFLDIIITSSTSSLQGTTSFRISPTRIDIISPLSSAASASSASRLICIACATNLCVAPPTFAPSNGKPRPESDRTGLPRREPARHRLPRSGDAALPTAGRVGAGPAEALLHERQKVAGPEWFRDDFRRPQLAAEP